MIPCEVCGKPVNVPDDWPVDWAIHNSCKGVS
jgi:hypothetical protein